MKCCNNEDNLKFGKSHSCFGWEIWYCNKCNSQFDVELIRDFNNKERHKR